MKTSKFVYCLLLFTTSLRATKPINHLRGVSHYSGTGEKNLSFDLGKMVFVFAKKPAMNLLPEDHSGDTVTTKSFFFPLTVVDNVKAKKMLKDFNRSVSKYYSFKLSQESKPIAGLRLSISYDPAKVSFEVRQSKRQGGVVEVLMYNRALLEEIRMKSSMQTRLAAVKKKEQSLLIVGMEGMIPVQPVMA